MKLDEYYQKLVRREEKVKKVEEELSKELKDKIEELKKYPGFGDPLFMKNLLDRIRNHPDFKQDFEFLEKLNEIAESLPTDFKFHLPYPLNMHLQYRPKGWSLIPWTIFSPTKKQAEQQLRFATAAEKVAGSKGEPAFIKMKELMKKEGEKAKRKKIDKITLRLKRAIWK